MKKTFLILTVMLVSFGLLAGCGGSQPAPAPAPAPAAPAPAAPAAPAAPEAPAGETGLDFSAVRLAFIHVGDPADMGYTYRQHQGTLDMMAKLGIADNQVMNFYNIIPGSAVDTAILEAIQWGADMIFGTSFAFEAHLIEAAREFPDLQFFHATGNQATTVNLPNMHNYFGRIGQARYLSGIAAGLKTESNVIGFVAAHPFAEVISGYTAFYMGAKSVNPDVTMLVMYTNAWNDPTGEQQAAQALIDRGADVLGQHADSTATQTTAEANGVWSVGYNNDMRSAAPNAVLISPMFDWSVYLAYAVESVVAGRDVPPDFIAGLEEGMVLISPVNSNIIAPGTEQAIADAEAKFRGGWNHLTGPINDNAGNQILAAGEEFVEPISAPSWAHIIEGITVIE